MTNINNFWVIKIYFRIGQLAFTLVAVSLTFLHTWVLSLHSVLWKIEKIFFNIQVLRAMFFFANIHFPFLLIEVYYIEEFYARRS